MLYVTFFTPDYMGTSRGKHPSCDIFVISEHFPNPNVDIIAKASGWVALQVCFHRIMLLQICHCSADRPYHPWGNEMKRPLLLLLFFLLSMSIFVYSQAEDSREYKISSGSKATWTRAALDPETGTVGFTWTSYKLNGQDQEKTWFATLSRKKDGSWKTSRPMMLDGNGSFSTICFNSGSNEFFLVWSNYAGGSSLRARHFGLDGKPQGETIYYNSYLKIDSTPAVAYNSKDDSYLLTWYAAKNIPTFPGDGGVIAVILNGHGAEISERMVIRRMVYTRNFFWYTYPLSARYNAKADRFHLVIRDYEVTDFSSDATKQHYYLYTLSPRAGIYKKTRVNKSSINYDNYSSHLELANYDKKNSNKNFLIYGDGKAIVHSKVSKTGNLAKSSTPIKSIAGASDPSIAYSPSKKSYLVVYSSDKGLQGIHLSSAGKPLESGSFQVSQKTKAGQKNARVLWNPVMQRYVVFWVEAATAQKDTIYTRFID